MSGYPPPPPPPPAPPGHSRAPPYATPTNITSQQNQRPPVSNNTAGHAASGAGMPPPPPPPPNGVASFPPPPVPEAVQQQPPPPHPPYQTAQGGFDHPQLPPPHSTGTGAPSYSGASAPPPPSQLISALPAVAVAPPPPPQHTMPPPPYSGGQPISAPPLPPRPHVSPAYPPPPPTFPSQQQPQTHQIHPQPAPPQSPRPDGFTPHSTTSQQSPSPANNPYSSGAYPPPPMANQQPPPMQQQRPPPDPRYPAVRPGHVPPPPPQPHQQHTPPPPPPPPPQHQQQRSNAASGVIDPSQLPRMPLFTRPQQPPDMTPVFYPKQALESSGLVLPPEADSRFLVQDDGNASPEMLRSTVHCMPQTRQVWHHTGDLPLAVVCTPLAVLPRDHVPPPRELPPTDDGVVNQEEWNEFCPVPLVDATDKAPPRCRNCAGYANPFFGADGVCNLCHTRNPGLMNDVDATVRQFGTVEYEVSGPYVTRESPVPPVVLYALDLTNPYAPAYLPLLKRLGADWAQHTLRQSTTPPPPRVGLALFCASGILIRDKSVTAPDHPGRWLVTSDVTTDPFSPLPTEAWTYPLTPSNDSEPVDGGLEQWNLFLDEVGGEWDALKKLAQGRTAQGLDGLELSVGGAAAKFLSHVLEDTGGRGTILTWKRPNYGAGNIPYREQSMKGGMVTGAYVTATPLPKQPKSSLGALDQTAQAFYTNLATECVQNRVALDVLVHTSPAIEPAFLDLATLGELCSQTCGHLFWISCHDWEEAMYQELKRQLQSYSGADAVFKLRCSNGLQIKNYFPGSGVVVDAGLGASPELDLPRVSSSTSITVELDHRVGGISKDQRLAFVQSALLYTTTSGRRRVRVSTLALRTTASVHEVFQSVDFGSTLTFFLRETVARMHKPQPGATDSERELTRLHAREALFNKAILILANYRQYTNAMSAPLSQLVLPERMQLFPIFVLSVLKSAMLRPGLAHRLGESQTPVLSPSGDERAFFMWHAARAHPAMPLIIAHPTLLKLIDHDQSNISNPDFVGEWQRPTQPEGGLGFVQMPTAEVASMASLDDDGVYVVDNGLSLFLVVGKSAPEEYRQRGGDSWKELVQREPKAARILWQLRVLSSSQHGPESEGLRPTFPPVVPVVLPEQRQRQGRRELEVMNLMVDDAVCGEKNLSEFLIHLHKKIGQRLEANKK